MFLLLCYVGCLAFFPPSPSFLYVSYLWKNGAPGRRFFNVTVCILHHLWQKGRGPPQYFYMCGCVFAIVLLDVLAVSPCLCRVSYVCSVLWFALCGCVCLFFCVLFDLFSLPIWCACVVCPSPFWGSPGDTTTHKHRSTQPHTTTQAHRNTQKHTIEPTDCEKAMR